MHRRRVYPLSATRTQIGCPPPVEEIGSHVDVWDPFRRDGSTRATLRGPHAADQIVPRMSTRDAS